MIELILVLLGVSLVALAWIKWQPEFRDSGLPRSYSVPSAKITDSRVYDPAQDEEKIMRGEVESYFD